MKYCDLTLIDLTYETDKIGNQIKKETRSRVFAEEKSVQSNEFFKAAALDLKASKMFEIHIADYNKQRQVEDEEGNRFDIYRTFVKGDKIELYCSEAKK
ncbi:MAG TPA: phage head-tail adapter protein [Dielma fastidiosa]|jgi:SPP1 family predicted phage head-tail adaptor|nr:phage head-tail adapter protein [Dielma fastidiosa]